MAEHRDQAFVWQGEKVDFVAIPCAVVCLHYIQRGAYANSRMNKLQTNVQENTGLR